MYRISLQHASMKMWIFLNANSQTRKKNLESKWGTFSTKVKSCYAWLGNIYSLMRIVKWKLQSYSFYLSFISCKNCTFKIKWFPFFFIINEDSFCLIYNDSLKLNDNARLWILCSDVFCSRDITYIHISQHISQQHPTREKWRMKVFLMFLHDAIKCYIHFLILHRWIESSGCISLHCTDDFVIFNRTPKLSSSFFKQITKKIITTKIFVLETCIVQHLVYSLSKFL